MNSDTDDLISAHRADVHPAPAHLKAQWHATIDEAAALERGQAPKPTETLNTRSFFWGTAVIAALAVGIGIGFFMADDRTIAEPVPTATPLAFSRGLQYHLRESRAQLVAYDTSTDSTALVLDIIAQNRVFETTAERNNAPRVARVLRAFEPILLRLAADDIAPADAEALREQLAFELNVMLTKLARESSERTNTT